MSGAPAGILVVAEHRQGELADITLEMLACGRDLADAAGMDLLCAVLTDDVGPFEGLPLAADTVLLVRDDGFRDFNPEAYAKALTALLRERPPRLVILGNTSSGTDLAGPLSLALDAATVGNAASVSWEAGTFRVAAKVYGGKILARCEIATPTGIVLLSAGNHPKERGTRSQLPAVEVLDSPVPLEPLRVKVSGFAEREAAGPDISKASILVAVGRGVRGKENLALAEDLAEVLGGVVAATRPVVDQGWLPASRQVGRSGMTVKPRLYLALGVSGAPEHVEGMKDSETIVAVNTDEGAPIFDVAHVGATVDLLDLVPLLTERIRTVKGGR